MKLTCKKVDVKAIVTVSAIVLAVVGFVMAIIGICGSVMDAQSEIESPKLMYSFAFFNNPEMMEALTKMGLAGKFIAGEVFSILAVVCAGISMLVAVASKFVDVEGVKVDLIAAIVGAATVVFAIVAISLIGSCVGDVGEELAIGTGVILTFIGTVFAGLAAAVPFCYPMVEKLIKK